MNNLKYLIFTVEIFKTLCIIGHAVLTTCVDFLTTLVGVSLKALLADAHSIVVEHLALSGGPAGPGARVAALLVDAGQVTGALTGCPALGPTVGRAALIARQAGAIHEIVLTPTLGVWPTWIRCTRIHWQRQCLALSD